MKSFLTFVLQWVLNIYNILKGILFGVQSNFFCLNNISFILDVESNVECKKEGKNRNKTKKYDKVSLLFRVLKILLRNF
jgi:hypothetical protein